MRVNLTFLVVALVMTSLFVGCGGGSSSGGSGHPTLSSISVSGPATMTIGTTGQFTATGKYSDGTTRTLGSSVMWASSSSAVATVDAMGKVTAVSSGPVTISATIGTISGSASLTVSAAISSIAVTPNPGSVNVNGTLQMTAIATLADGSTQDITATANWSSSLPNIASVAATGGLVTGVSKGTASIKASLSGISGQSSVTVNAVLTSISITPNPSSVVVGSTLSFVATGNYNDGSTKVITTSVTWSSSNPAAATIVATTGVATGVAKGTTTISALSGTVTGTSGLSVTPSLVSIAVTPNPGSVAVNGTLQMTAIATFSDSTTQDITATANWTSSLPNIASVASLGGLVTGVSNGTATIKAAQGGASGQSSVTVNAVLTSIAVTPNPSSVVQGSTLQFTATGTYNDGSTKTITTSVTWTSSATGVATVGSTTGLATGVSKGSTIITATSGTVSGTSLLSVTPSISSIAVTPNPGSVSVNGTLQMTAIATFSDSTTQDITATANWTSSIPTIATVSNPGGLVSGVSKGTSTIKASSGGVFGTSSVTVSTTLTSITLAPNPASVLVNSNLQFSATGHYSDGSSQDITNQVSWTSSDPTKATITPNAGLAVGKASGQTTITATQGSVSGTDTLTVKALLQSISVSPLCPGVQVTKTQQLTATGFFNDGTSQDLTSSATWSSSDNTKATVNSSGLASGLSAGAATLTATAVAADGTSVSGSTALNVVTPFAVAPSLSGTYAFNLLGADTRGSQFYAGSFVADGHGNISGVEDSNTSSGVHTNVALSGTYFVYPDGRGQITFNANAIYPTGITLRFILSRNGGASWTLGKMMEFDGKGTARGSFELQDSSAFNDAGVSGTYVFRNSGMDSLNNPMGQVGLFVADGAGNISGGDVDTNDFGSISSAAITLNATTYVVNDTTHGRGTLQLTTASASANFAFYIINANKVILLQTDTGANSALAGVAELQAAQTFTAGSLNGGYVFLLDQSVLVGPTLSQDRGEFNQVGHWAFDAVSHVDGTQDEDSFSGNPLTGIMGSYAVGALNKINGRGTMTNVTSIGNRSYVFYMVSTSKVYVLETFLGATTGASNAPTGVAEAQSGAPFSQSTLNGSYAVDSSEVAEEYSEALLQLEFSGAGAISGVADLSVNGVVSCSTVTPVYSSINPNPDPTLGRGVISLPPELGSNDVVFYLRDAKKGFLMGVNPDTDGSITQQ